MKGNMKIGIEVNIIGEPFIGTHSTDRYKVNAPPVDLRSCSLEFQVGEDLEVWRQRQRGS